MVVVVVVILGLSASVVSLLRVASPNESYGLLIVIDGARGDVWKRYAQEGRLPNVKRLFFDEGLWVNHASTVFPSITGAGITGGLDRLATRTARHPLALFF